MLKFVGDWAWWQGGLLALALGAAAWLLYRRDTGGRARGLGWVLPTLRALAVVLAVLLLTGPVLHHRRVVGDRARVHVVVDASRSMRLTDEAMEPARKLVFLHRMGWIPPEALDTNLARAADAVARARRIAAGAEASPAEAAPRAAREIEEAFEALGRVRPETSASAMERKGLILLEFWQNIPGGAVSDLTRNPAFPGKPSSSATPDIFESRVDWAENYGTRMRGYVHPPATGNYVFWIAGDDQCELWLSADEDPAKKALVARVSSWTPPRGWDALPEQKSKPVRLVAGLKYYIEALHKESSGGDSCAVGWQLPGGKLERPIPGSRLSAQISGDASPARAHEALVARFRQELLVPAQELPGKGHPAKAQALAAAAARWEKELREAFAHYAERAASSPDASVRAALRTYDQMSRWKRAEALLAGGGRSLLEQLAEKHLVEVVALSGGKTEVLWSQSGEREVAGKLPRALPGDPGSRVTNLSDGLKALVGEKSEQRAALVLLSDGRHNEGSSPLAAAKMIGSRGVPVYTVGLGGTAAPEDLAILEVRGPESVFFKDRVKGEVVLKDDAAPGKPFVLRAEAGGAVVWEKALTTERTHRRTIPYDFPLQPVVEKRVAQKEKDVEILNLPLTVRFTATPVEGEKERENNDASHSLRAIMHRRKLLLLDGRARWEFRYARNLFDRDEQWEVNSLLADRGAGGAGWTRGPKPGQFPPDRESLFAYDLIVFGEVPRQHFRMEELKWIREFVEKRGGGLLVIDGRRGHLGTYAETEIGPLIPVDWKGDQVAGRPSRLGLSEKGALVAALNLGTADARNEEIWAALPPPHWVVPARALPGSETLVEAVVGERKIPAVVYRRFGAGRVLYHGFDESWRWRYEVADRHHLRYWNQMVRWIMEPPFAVRDARVSLDAGAVTYAEGDSVEIRARLRDAQGKPVSQANAEAHLYREMRRVAVVKLAPDDNAGGIFLGRTGALPGGRYEVRVRVEGLHEGDSKAQTEFTVLPREAGELAVLSSNEELLRQMAAQAGGEYFREEEIASLVARLEPLSRERVVESSTILWQSYWWFVPLVALLAIEWVIRKWAGML